jgi:LacI family transcriptional regulator
MGRTPKDSITIADVARAAEVSRATVSRVMNGRLTVAPEIAERVRAAADRLNYRPSDLARSLSLGRTNMVALVVPDLGNPLFQQILRGITNASAAAGYKVLVAETDEDPAAEAARAHLSSSLTALREELEHDEAFQEADAAAKAQQERATPEH